MLLHGADVNWRVGCARNNVCARQRTPPPLMRNALFIFLSYAPTVNFKLLHSQIKRFGQKSSVIKKNSCLYIIKRISIYIQNYQYIRREVYVSKIYNCKQFSPLQNTPLYSQLQSFNYPRRAIVAVQKYSRGGAPTKKALGPRTAIRNN